MSRDATSFLSFFTIIIILKKHFVRNYLLQMLLNARNDFQKTKLTIYLMIA